jgi:hypothetical protein
MIHYIILRVIINAESAYNAKEPCYQHDSPFAIAAFKGGGFKQVLTIEIGRDPVQVGGLFLFEVV